MRHLPAIVLAMIPGLVLPACSAASVEESAASPPDAGAAVEPSSPDASADGAPSSSTDAASAGEGGDESAARQAMLDAVRDGVDQPEPAPIEPAIPAVSERPPGLAPSVVWFAPFGPTPGCPEEEFVRLSGAVGARYLEDPDADLAAELDAVLADAEIGDVTPPAINALLGLDMADPEDTARADALMEWWYAKQVEYKQVVLHGDPEDVRDVVVKGRLASIDGWVRWWRRTLERADGLEIFRTRVSDLRAYLEADRERRREGAPTGEG